MNSFIDQYVKQGLTDVVAIDSSSHEDTSGYEYETETEVVVARVPSGGFKKISSRLERRFGPASGLRVSFQEYEISEVEYLSCAKKGVPVDLTEALSKAQAEDQAAAANNKLKTLAPICPKDGRKMHLKTSKHGDFWGCPKYPTCKEKAKLTAEQLAVLQMSRKI